MLLGIVSQCCYKSLYPMLVQAFATMAIHVYILRSKQGSISIRKDFMLVLNKSLCPMLVQALGAMPIQVFFGTNKDHQGFHPCFRQSLYPVLVQALAAMPIQVFFGTNMDHQGSHACIQQIFILLVPFYLDVFQH